MSLLLKNVRPPEIRCHVRSPEQEDVSLLEGVQQECVCRCQHAQGPEEWEEHEHHVQHLVTQQETHTVVPATHHA